MQVRIKERCPKCREELMPLYASKFWFESNFPHKRRQKWIRISRLLHCESCQTIVKLEPYRGLRVVLSLKPAGSTQKL